MYGKIYSDHFLFFLILWVRSAATHTKRTHKTIVSQEFKQAWKIRNFLIHIFVNEAFGRWLGCLFLIHMNLVLFYGHQYHNLCRLVLTWHQIIHSELPYNRAPGFQDRKPRNCHCFKRVAQNSGSALLVKHTPEIALILRKENDTLTLDGKTGLYTQQQETCMHLSLHQFAAERTS